MATAKVASKYWDAVKADNEWQAELERVYGKQAGDARYDQRGKATSRLAELWAAKRAADEALIGAEE